MEERCKAIEMAGAICYINPKGCEPVKSLLDSFGEHKRELQENYYYNLLAD